jgi:acetyl-CoA carboxylase biotin carboxylase subunit
MIVVVVSTNIPLHRDLMEDTKFIDGGTSIHYLEHKMAQRKQKS